MELSCTIPVSQFLKPSMCQSENFSDSLLLQLISCAYMYNIGNIACITTRRQCTYWYEVTRLKFSGLYVDNQVLIC